jgi:hypothetical protein
MKKLMALILAAALTLVSSVVVFANEPAPVVNIPFTGTVRNFVGNGSMIIGRLPNFANNTALSNRIYLLASDVYQAHGFNNLLPVIQGANNNIVFNFVVTESLTTAKIEITVLDPRLRATTIGTYFVNKANNAEITAAAFDAAFITEAEANAAYEAAQNAGETAEESPIVGSWFWDEDDDWEYVFNSDGTGTRGFISEELIFDFLWTIEGDLLTIDMTVNFDHEDLEILEEEFFLIEEWTFVIDGDSLTLTSRQVEDMEYTYVR